MRLELTDNALWEAVDQLIVRSVYIVTATLSALILLYVGLVYGS